MHRIKMAEDRIPSEEAMVELLKTEGMLPALIDADGRILTDNTGAIVLG